ncbi:MAG: sulfatase [Chthoniobacteraceae bacterium]
MTHRLLYIAALLLTPLTGMTAAEPAKKPNILWLISEDTGPEALSRSGAPQTATPTLDKLAKEGVYYSHTYLGTVCSVSRSSFMTGMYAVSIGAQNHRTLDKKPLPNGVRLLTGWMRDAHYFTANIVQLPAALGFAGKGKTDWNFTFDGEAFDSSNWDDLKPHQPFFAQINFQETHRVYHAPAKADPAKVALPPYYPDTPIVREDWAKYLDSEIEFDRKVSLVLEQLKRDGLADNTIIVYFGDNGASMARAKQFCYEESFLVPMIMHWPKDFPAPKHYQPGTVDSRFIDGIDLAPTMLAIAGAPIPPKMQGRSFLGENAEASREYVFGTRDRCDETPMRIRSVRDAHYRYIHNFTPEVPFLAPNNYKETEYPVWNVLKQLHAEGKLTPPQEFLCQPRMPDEELYNMDADPSELQNLAASDKPEDQAELKKLRAVLDQWIVDVNDHGRIMESPETIRAALQPKAGKQKRKDEGK